MAGQISHFVNYAPQDGNKYSRDRYANEYNRCIGVFERRLEGRKFIVSVSKYQFVIMVKKIKGFGEAYSTENMIKGAVLNWKFLTTSPHIINNATVTKTLVPL